MATYHVIGQSTPRVDGTAKATGQARYVADVSLLAPSGASPSIVPTRTLASSVLIRQRRSRSLAFTRSSRALMSGVDCGAGQ